ncbi:hypothetical protein E2P81_ATG01032 [Venturia nashicola]|uniref:Uncharacterized protein n=1 Tax=Venturia nashicola TaxID=86259 RepID=A0A4Z1PAY3_9PEZI|nr:hypothetical protein E6O75_ATG01055 [Venturia nashicola]TLD38489.1 hypothetical protein E2P81_ATG01032 [Venturia nashicola]
MKTLRRNRVPTRPSCEMKRRGFAWVRCDNGVSVPFRDGAPRMEVALRSQRINKKRFTWFQKQSKTHQGGKLVIDGARGQEQLSRKPRGSLVTVPAPNPGVDQSTENTEKG